MASQYNYRKRIFECNHYKVCNYQRLGHNFVQESTTVAIPEEHFFSSVDNQTTDL
jgi:hypothetical protein